MTEASTMMIGNDICPHCLARHPSNFDCRAYQQKQSLLGEAMTEASTQATWPALGTVITYSSAGRHREWSRGGPYYFAGVTVRLNNEPSVWVADRWPVQCIGDLTDGFTPEEWGLGALRSPAPAENKIVAGMREAVAYAQGDKTMGTILPAPPVEASTQATWPKDERRKKEAPHTADRKYYMAPAGLVHCRRKRKAQAERRTWVRCPVCGEPDMEKLTDEDSHALILCVNHACASNGGANSSALAAVGALRSPASEPQKDTPHHAADGNLVGGGTGVGLGCLPSVAASDREALAEWLYELEIDPPIFGLTRDQAKQITTKLIASGLLGGRVPTRDVMNEAFDEMLAGHVTDYPKAVAIRDDVIATMLALMRGKA